MTVLTPSVQNSVAQLLSNSASLRLRGVDGAFDAVTRQGVLQPMAPALCPLLLRLGTAPSFPEASLLLTRLFGLLGTLDDPPRSCDRATTLRGSPPSNVDRVMESFRSQLSELLRTAAKSPDPESNRAAAYICAHFPEVDNRTELHLIALTTGAPDEETRARILYHLTLVQLGLKRNHLHPQSERALERSSAHLEGAAVALACREAGEKTPRRLRSLANLRLDRLKKEPHLSRSWPDPRRWGRLFPSAF